MKELTEYRIPEIRCEKLFRIRLELGEPYPIGETAEGYREVVPVTGGSFQGEISGNVMDFGGDWGLLQKGTDNIMNNHVILQTEDGQFITMDGAGRFVMPPDLYERAAGGETVEPEEYYFRQTLQFTAGEGPYQWLNNIVAVSTVIITEEGDVCMDIYKII